METNSNKNKNGEGKAAKKRVQDDMLDFAMNYYVELVRTKGNEMPLDEFCNVYGAPMIETMKMISDTNEVVNDE